MTSTPYEIFLSYCHKNKEDIDELYEILTNRYKLNIWKDTKSIRMGHDFREEIFYGIENSKLILSCVSKDYIESKNCMREIKIANKLEKKCLFLLLEPIDVDKIPSISMLVIDEQRCHIFANREQDPNAKLWTGELFSKFVDDIGLILGKNLKQYDSVPKVKVVRSQEKFNAFLSYNVEIQPTIQSLHQQLEDNDLIIHYKAKDKNNLNWKYFMKMKEAIDSSTVFIGCITVDYLTNGNCLNEIDYARETKKPKIIILFENISKNHLDLVKSFTGDDVFILKMYEDAEKSYLMGTGEQFQKLLKELQELINKLEKKQSTESTEEDKMQTLYDLFVTCDDEQIGKVATFLSQMKNFQDLRIFHDAANSESKKRKPNYDAIKKSETVLAIVSKNFPKSNTCIEELSFAYRNFIPTNILVDDAALSEKNEELNEIIEETPEKNVHKDVNMLDSADGDNVLIKSIVDELKIKKGEMLPPQPPKPEEPKIEVKIELPKEKTKESIRVPSAVKRPPSVKKPQTPQHMPFHEAADKNNMEEIKYWLSAGKNINEKDARGMTVLHIASREGHLDMVKYLVDQNADRDEKDSDGRTPLHLAATDGRLEVVEYLCKDCKLDFNAKDWRGLTPLHLASQWGYLDVVQYLCEKGANVNEKSKDNWTPLYLASTNRRESVAKVLRINGAR